MAKASPSPTPEEKPAAKRDIFSPTGMLPPQAPRQEERHITDTQLLGGTGGIPEPRGVRLLSATELPELSGFNPHVTTITTDTTFAQQQDDRSSR